MTAATPETVTRLDAQTEAELQPPCEITFSFLGLAPQRCENPAAWIVRTQCVPPCGKVITLVCNEHLATLRLPAARIVCRNSHLITQFEWEKL